MNYSPKVFNGKHFEEIFAELTFASKTPSLVRVLENIKHKQAITSISGEITVQDYAVTPTTPTTGITFSDAEVEPLKKMVYMEYNYEDLRSSRFAESMKSGAANVVSDEFDKAVLAFTQNKIALGMEKEFWISALAALSASSAPTKLAASGITATNLKAVFDAVYSAIDGEVLASADCVIFADHSVKKLVMQANSNATYRDIFTVAGDSHSYLGVKIEYVPLGANKMTAGIASDYIWATDLMSDLGQITIDKVAANSDQYFIKAVFTQDADVCIKSQKVLLG